MKSAAKTVLAVCSHQLRGFKELLYSGTRKVPGDGKTCKEKPIPMVVLADRYSLPHPADFVEGWIAMRESSVSDSRSSWNVSHVLVQR